MENNEREQLKNTYPSNSKMTKKDSSQPDKVGERKLEKVVTGTVKKQKRGFGKKLAETFLEDDTKSVGSYIFHDVLIPAAKAMISDMVGGGLEMLLFGEKRGRNSRRDTGGRSSFTSYGSYYRSTDRERDRDKDRGREMSRTGRARHDFDEIVLETRGEAEEVLSHLVDLTIDYNQATVADLYDLVGISSNFTDNKYGWTDLRGVAPRRVRDGYLLDLPRAQPLD